jgi:hypothetical protein
MGAFVRIGDAHGVDLSCRSYVATHGKMSWRAPAGDRQHQFMPT